MVVSGRVGPGPTAVVSGLLPNPSVGESRLPRAGPREEPSLSREIKVNKVSDKQKRRAEHIEDKLEKQGMGRDQAEQEALRQAVDEQGPSAGGAHAAADSPKHANHERDHRLGSDKTFHSGQP